MDLSRRHLYAYLALGIVVVAVGGRYLLTARAASRPVPSGEMLGVLAASPSPSAVPTPGGSALASPRAVVAYICGAVAHPGVYSLLAGARIGDLLQAAGGAGAKADLTQVNLAAPVTDGQQVVVPKRGAPGAAVAAAPGAPAPATGGTSATGGATLVSLNSATLEQLDTLQGVGPATAQKIIDYRTANGGFKTIDELKNVSGIGEARFAALKDYVTL